MWLLEWEMVDDVWGNFSRVQSEATEGTTPFFDRALLVLQQSNMTRGLNTPYTNTCPFAAEESLWTPDSYSASNHGFRNIKKC